MNISLSLHIYIYIYIALDQAAVPEATHAQCSTYTSVYSGIGPCGFTHGKDLPQD